MLNANSQQSTGTESWAGWLPVKLRFEPTKTGGQGISVAASWANVGAERLVDPFLHETVARLDKQTVGAGAVPLRRHTSGAEELLAAASSVGDRSVAPTAIIFHCSRCGSTLLCNALRAVASNAVVAEPGALNDLLRYLLYAKSDHGSLNGADAPGGGPGLDGRALAHALATLFGQQRRPAEMRFILKTSSWNILHGGYLLSALPSAAAAASTTSEEAEAPIAAVPTPWVFLFRDPVEVAVSQLREPSGWMRLQKSRPSAAARLFGLRGAAEGSDCINIDTQEAAAAAAAAVAEERVRSMSPEEWCAYGLHRFFCAALALADDKNRGGAILIDYEDLFGSGGGRHYGGEVMEGTCGPLGEEYGGGSGGSTAMAHGSQAHEHALLLGLVDRLGGGNCGGEDLGDKAAVLAVLGGHSKQGLAAANAVEAMQTKSTADNSQQQIESVAPPAGGSIDASTRRWQADGAAKRAQASPELLQALQSVAHDCFAAYKRLRAHPARLCPPVR